LKNRLLAKRYSKAVLQNLKEKDYNPILSDIKLIKNVLTKDKDILKTINSFLLPQTERISIAVTVIENTKLKKIWQNLFKILIQKHKYTLLPTILIELETLILELKNQINVQLILASDQSDANLKKIKNYIEDILKKEIIIKIKIDPEIIGGFIVHTDSNTLDGSIINNLRKFASFND